MFKSLLSYVSGMLGVASNTQRYKSGLGKNVHNEPIQIVYDEQYGVYVRKRLRGGKVLSTRCTAESWKPRTDSDYEVGVPEVAPGRWLLIGDGDYKSVYAAEDGRSDYVVKRYDQNVYVGPDAKAKAEVAARLLEGAHQIIAKDLGRYTNVQRIVAAPVTRTSGGQSWGVYEVSKRALFALFIDGNDELSPKGATEKVRIAEGAVEKSGHRVHRLNDKARKGHLDVEFDLVTQEAVITDVIDKVFV